MNIQEQIGELENRNKELLKSRRTFWEKLVEAQKKEKFLLGLWSATDLKFKKNEIKIDTLKQLLTEKKTTI